MRDLDRGVLARLDRKLLAGLGQDETYRMVRVPVTAAKWSTWKRYCESAGVSMGRAIATLIDRELVSVFGAHADERSPVFAGKAEVELARRREQAAGREEKAAVVEERLRDWNAHLRRWEVELETRERRVEFAAKMAAQPGEAEAKVGRNERCPCGSGRKYKHRHGLPGRMVIGFLAAVDGTRVVRVSNRPGNDHWTPATTEPITRAVATQLDQFQIHDVELGRTRFPNVI